MLPSSTPHQVSRLLFGCGYLGSRLARLWRNQGHSVAILTRSPQRAASWSQQGFLPFVGDILEPPTLKQLPSASAVIFAVGWDRASTRPQRDVYVGGLKNVLECLEGAGPPPQKLLYVSSTGVYGQVMGSEVDETTPCHPTREGGRCCLEAERLLAASSLASRALILRMAGLYGPGRLPRRADLESGAANDLPREGFLNLIHVEDAASALELALASAQPPRTYVVSDGAPVWREDYYREVARQLGLTMPARKPATSSGPRAERATSDKRVNPRRLFDELGFRPRYPSYHEGIAASLAAEVQQG